MQCYLFGQDCQWCMSIIIFLKFLSYHIQNLSTYTGTLYAQASINDFTIEGRKTNTITKIGAKFTLRNLCTCKKYALRITLITNIPYIVG